MRLPSRLLEQSESGTGGAHNAVPFVERGFPRLWKAVSANLICCSLIIKTLWKSHMRLLGFVLVVSVAWLQLAAGACTLNWEH